MGLYQIVRGPSPKDVWRLGPWPLAEWATTRRATTTRLIFDTMLTLQGRNNRGPTVEPPNEKELARSVSPVAALGDNTNDGPP